MVRMKVRFENIHVDELKGFSRIIYTFDPICLEREREKERWTLNPTCAETQCAWKFLIIISILPPIQIWFWMLWIWFGFHNSRICIRINRIQLEPQFSSTKSCIKHRNFRAVKCCQFVYVWNDAILLTHILQIQKYVLRHYGNDVLVKTQSHVATHCMHGIDSNEMILYDLCCFMCGSNHKISLKWNAHFFDEIWQTLNAVCVCVCLTAAHNSLEVPFSNEYMVVINIRWKRENIALKREQMQGKRIFLRTSFIESRKHYRFRFSL